jgi:hypothetical protein
MLKGITVTPTQKSAQAREAVRKLVGECSCLKWRMEVITRRFPNTASTAPKRNTAYRIIQEYGVGPRGIGSFHTGPVHILVAELQGCRWH